ncbi:MAG: DMP19 family protein [Candidatus Hydrogenedentes bacterium]|nr:DMP19 family protein [Candidatus Hydrogenedentota bacterium]
MKNFVIAIIASVAVVAVAVLAVPRWKQAQRANKASALLEEKYGAMGITADQILSHEGAEDAGKILGALCYRIGQKADTHGEHGLTDTERKFLAADWLEGEVDNGGFDQYFFNPSGDNSMVALAGLREMGASGAAALLERAVAVFPGGKPPTDTAKRREMMEQIAARSGPVWEQCDSEFYRLSESFSDLSLAYAKKKRAEIVLP